MLQSSIRFVNRLFDKELSVFSNSSQWDLVSNLVKRNLTVRYKRSSIGFLWTMLNPIIMTAVYTVVFSTIFRFETQDFIIYFLSGFLVWNFFAQTTMDGSRCILEAGSLIKKVYVPKQVFVYSIVISNLVNLGFAIIPLMALVMFMGKGLTLSLVYLVPVTIMATLFTLGVSLIVSTVSAFFHDIGEMFRILLTPWMFLTPIMYPMDIIPQKYVFLFKLNPMYYLVECFRTPLYKGIAPDINTVAMCAILAIVSFTIGHIVFKRSEDSLIYYV